MNKKSLQYSFIAALLIFSVAVQAQQSVTSTIAGAPVLSSGIKGSVPPARYYCYGRERGYHGHPDRSRQWLPLLPGYADRYGVPNGLHY